MKKSRTSRNAPLKLGFQGWFLTEPYAGIGQHCIGMLRALAEEAGTARAPRGTSSVLQITIPVPRRVTVKGVPSAWIKVVRPKWWIPLAGLRKWYWERVQAPAFFARQNPDWEYYPYPCPLPRYSPNMRAMTVHDTILWQDKRYAAGGIRGALKRNYHKQTRRALVGVDHIFAVSESTEESLGIPAATILPNGAPDLPAKLKKSKKNPYAKALVYVGGYDIRKQVPQLVEAFTALRKKHQDLKLILIGEAHHASHYYPLVPEAEGVVQLGRVSDTKLYEVLSQAFAFVHFSDSEGFNIPLLQAMLAGTPAIVRDIPVNREVSGGTALFMKPTGARHSLKKALSDKIALLQSEKKRSAIVAAQKKVARKYSWKKSAKIFLKELR